MERGIVFRWRGMLVEAGGGGRGVSSFPTSNSESGFLTPAVPPPPWTKCLPVLARSDGIVGLCRVTSRIADRRSIT